MELAGPRLEQRPAPAALGAPRAGGDLVSANLTQSESEGAGVSEPTEPFFKPDKGFLTSPDGAGVGGGGTPRPRPTPTPGAVAPTSLCSSPAPATPPGKPVFNLSSIGTQL